MSKLVITEKPSVAQNIAAALGITDRKDGYLEGNGYIISWCVGHLIELATPDSYDEKLKKWAYETLPIIPTTWNYMIKEDTKGQFRVLESLMKKSDVTSVVCATDAGREGELIFRLVYMMAKCNKPVERLWISSMEEQAIRDGFDNLRPGGDYDKLYQSALCRQRADWLVGINGTRLFTVLYKGKVLNVGRVQTPTLAMLVDREAQIMGFKKEPYYTVELQMGNLLATSEKFKERAEAENVMNKCCEEAFVSSYKSEEKTINPPKLYDLTSLQRDANRLFGYTAKQTLEYAQSLYEKKLLTYPRTDSRFLTEDMEETARSIIQVIAEEMDFISPFEKDIRPNVRLVLDSKKVSDHHAIIPTMEIKNGMEEITAGEKKLLNLVACRLLCATGSKHIYISDTAVINCNDMIFKMCGKHIKETGWKAFEESFRVCFQLKNTSENGDDIPKEPMEGTGISLSEGEILKVTNTEIKQGFTKPPVHFTEATLLHTMELAGAKEMSDEVERKGLGTPATRADIIEKLVSVGYVKREKKQLIPTDDGMKLITVLPEVVKSPQLTADWENELTLVAKGETSAEQFMSGIKSMIEDLVKTYNCITDEDKKNYFKPVQKSLGNCPRCGKPVYMGKYGVYCSGKCGMTLGRAMGATLSENEVESLLAGKQILVKGLRGKSGKVYDAYLRPKGIEEYSYRDKDGNDRSGYQFKFEMSFPKK